VRRWAVFSPPLSLALSSPSLLLPAAAAADDDDDDDDDDDSRLCSATERG